ncbi:MAG: hypothetical protein GYB35_15055 [Algicola sp.]|nr:hypothetical protein [Algicola sp.]
MKNFIRFYVLFCLIVVSFSCSEDDSDDIDTSPGNFNITNFEIIPNTANSLVSKVFVENDQATSYFYGDSDVNGTIDSISGIAYQETNSSQITYFTLDDLGRLSYMYYEINGVKDSQIINFTYPESDLVNVIFLERDWDTGTNTLVEFVPVNTEGDNFVANPLLNRQTSDSSLYQFLASHIGTIAGVVGVVAVTAAGVAVGGVALGVIGGLLVSTALLADETNNSDAPVVSAEPDEPNGPEEEEVETNQCENSNLSVVIGVDSGNVLVAIVNGDSATYDFCWSTGQTDNNPISDTITVTEDGNYYVIVEDDNGCVAFASATVSTEVEVDIFGTWNFDENSNCVDSNGNTFSDNGSGEILTLNEDFTAILPDDSNGNYLTNGFTFENGVLSINLSYQDFFDPPCGGVNFQTATNSMTLTYDESTDTFTGTSQSSRNDVNGPDCDRFGSTCTGTVTMYR